LDTRSDTPRDKTRGQNLQIHPDKFYASTCKTRLSLQTGTFQYNPRERVQNECNRLTKAQCSRHILPSIEHAMRASPFGHVLLFKMADEVLEADIASLDHYDYFFRPDLLSGKVAFITGGGSGIGFTITEVFMRYVT